MSFLSAVADQLEAAKDVSDPVDWVTGQVGEYVWSKQAEVMHAIAESRKVAVQSCHSAGKSHLASRIAAWWLATKPVNDAFVVTTAPTYAQVRAILWRYIRQVHRKAILPGRVNQTEWFINDDLVAFGRKPADYDEAAFQGIHAKYVLAIIDEACHDDQTDVMTDRGWRRFADLRGDELLLTMDPTSHEARFRRPERIIAKPYTGPMYLYEAKGANYCVTPDHQMYFHGRSHNHDTAWRKAPVTDLAGADNKYMAKAIRWAAPDVEFYEIPSFRTPRKAFPARLVPMDEWMEFLGWYCSEGSLVRSRGRLGGVSISQKADEALSRIHKLCLRLGLPAKLYRDQVRIHSRQVGELLAQLGDNCLEKRPPAYARMVSARQIGLFLDAFSEGDGYRKGRGEILYTSSPGMADDLQEMILKTGMPSVVRRRALVGQVNHFVDGHTATSSTDGFVVTRPAEPSKVKHFPKNGRWVDYDGMVYCASIPPESLLLTRRRGYTLWSGNCGIPEQLWVAVDSITTGENDRILAIGNPDNPASHFAAVCNPANRASTGWRTIRISAFDTPNLTGEDVPDDLRYVLVSKKWVDEKRTEWGEDSAIYQSKVLGEFPPDDPAGVIRPSDIAKCRVGTETPRVEDLLVELGVDVGGGGDETVIRERRGPHAGREWRSRSDRPEDLAPLVLKAIRETGASAVKLDRIGVGAGLVGELRNMQAGGLHSARILGVNVAEKASDPIKFANLRAEIWWMGRSLSESRGWDLSSMDNDDTTCAQLLAPRWSLDNKGRILVEPKVDVIKRIGRSPDNADALLLAFYSPRGDLTQFFERAVSSGAAYPNSRRFTPVG